MRQPGGAGAGWRWFSSTATSLSLAKTALSLGVTGLLAVTPYYNKPPQEGLYQHFWRCARWGTDRALQRAGADGLRFAARTVARLCDRPEIVALKEASGQVGRTQALSRLLGDRLLLLSGEDALNLPLYSVGASGAISVLSNVVPQAVVDVFRRFGRGEHAAALELHQRYVPLVDLLFSEPNPIPVQNGAAHDGTAGQRAASAACADEPAWSGAAAAGAYSAGLCHEQWNFPE